VNEEGSVQRPDFILKLSNDNSVILDAKVSLNNYEQYINCDLDNEKTNYFSSFVQDIKNHIDNLSGKSYHNVISDMQSIKILGSIMLFIPLESTYYETLRYENGFLHDYAWKKGIVIVGPYNLMPILKVLDSLSKIEKQNKNSQEIAKLGGQMYDKFAALLDGITKFKKSFETLGKNFDEDIVKKLEGRGNLLTKAKEMEKLGIKSDKQIPYIFDDIVDA
jgi:DNA recombination protein RmuC